MDSNTLNRESSLSDSELRGRLRYVQRSSRYESNRVVARRPIDGISLKKPTKSLMPSQQTATPVKASPVATPTLVKKTFGVAPVRQAPQIQDIARGVRSYPAKQVLSSSGPNPVIQEPAATKVTSKLEVSREGIAKPSSSKNWQPKLFYAIAVMLLLTGGVIAYNGWYQAKQTSTVVHKLQQDSSNTSSDVPSTRPVTSHVKAAYAVAPGLPRYLNIPNLKVHARVLQTGLTSSGAIGTPSNVFDTAWYTGSSQPGQAGATLIDGHVSSWTSHGVFYGLDRLVAGDKIQINTGANKTYTYKVIKIKKFDHDKVDMQSALTPIVKGKPGLNLITCTGDVISGTNEFDERIIVYTTQVSVSSPKPSKANN